MPLGLALYVYGLVLKCSGICCASSRIHQRPGIQWVPLLPVWTKSMLSRFVSTILSAKGLCWMVLAWLRNLVALKGRVLRFCLSKTFSEGWVVCVDSLQCCCWWWCHRRQRRYLPSNKYWGTAHADSSWILLGNVRPNVEPACLCLHLNRLDWDWMCLFFLRAIQE